MGVGDPIEIRYNERHKFYYVGQGREARYDPVTRELIRFDTWEECQAWIIENEGVTIEKDNGA